MIRSLHKNLSFPLIIISAPAGSGKTTLLADLIKRSKKKFAWLSIKSEDNDLAVLFADLASSVAARLPSLKSELYKFSHRPIQQSPEEIARLFTEIISRKLRKRHLHVVLDDFHFLADDNKVVHEFINTIIIGLPEKLHLVISSQKRPSLPIPRFALNQAVFQINFDDLCFTKKEIKQLLHDIYKIRIPDTILHQITVATNGWPAALVLIRHLIELTEGRNPKIFPTMLTETADFLTQKLPALFSPQERNQILKTSFLPYLDGKILKVVLGSIRPYRLIERLYRLQFIHPVTRDRFTYYQVFQDCFRDILKKTITFDELNKLNQKIARYLESEHNPGLALSYYINGENLKDGLRILRSYGPQLLQTGRCRTLLNYMDMFPPSFQDAPLFLLYSASIERFYGRWIKAKDHYQRALNKITGDNYFRCLYGLGATHLVLGEPAKARHLAQVGLKKAKKPRLRMILCNLLSTSYYEQGDIKSAIKIYKRALRFATKLGDEQSRAVLLMNLGVAYSDSGQFDRAIRTYTTTLNIIGPDSPYSALIYTNLGSTYLKTGQLAKALGVLAKGMTIAKRYGRKYDQIYLLQHLGDLAIRKREFNKAETILHDLEKKSTNITEGHIPALVDLYWSRYFFESGQYFKAKEKIESALRHRLGRILKAEIMLWQARIFLKTGFPKEAKGIIKEAIKKIREQDCVFHLAQALFFMARCNRMIGLKFDDYLSEAISIAKKYRYKVLILREMDESPELEMDFIRLAPFWMIDIAITSGRSDLLYRVVELGITKAGLAALKEIRKLPDIDLMTLQNILPIVRPRMRPALMKVISEVGRQKKISIRLFGGFQAIRGDEIINIGSTLAKKILTYLIMKDRNRANAQELTRIFWKQDYKKARNRLYFTINLIRKIHPKMVVRDLGFYRLRTDLIQSDYLQFLDLVRRGLAQSHRDQKRSIAFLREALSISKAPLVYRFEDPIFETFRDSVAQKRAAVEGLLTNLE